MGDVEKLQVSTKAIIKTWRDSTPLHTSCVFSADMVVDLVGPASPLLQVQ
jgi:hypothetical protein